jgi:hypothetical protein
MSLRKLCGIFASEHHTRYLAQREFIRDFAPPPPQPAQPEQDEDVAAFEAALDKLAQQEPVASCNGMPAYEGPLSKALLVGVCASEGHKIQAQRPWVGLTAEEAAECWTTSATQTWKNFETKLKEKNT